MSSEKPVTIGTHSGIFHCDEILACFMLRQLPQYANAKILRSRDEKVLKDCDIVVDVGGQYDKSKNLFDHHQKSFVHTFSSLRPEYPNYDKVRLSSAGLIYTHFGEEVIREILKKQCDLTIDNHLLGKIFEKVYQGLIQEIDGIDNGVPMFDGEPKYRITSDISSRVGRFNPDWNATEGVDVQQQFEKAMVIAGEEFLDRVLYYGSVWHPARAIVEEALENRFTIHSSGQILSLDRICPWKDHLFDVEKEKELVGVAKYVLFCSGRDDYRAIAVPKEPGSFILRKALHKDWQGVRDADLQKICGIEGAVFVHATGFIGGNKTMQGALEMAIKSLEADE
ncbi:MYG1 protein isoform X2 [Bradysia coprophila]|nr:MYG1 protein isoform X2 [Bradysia coprophila]